ncbi:nitroreductase/quinone reductase family protein [Streptomyces sp. NPDC006632]|uniref:nitroreductase/quinone reductase family protein n=1 Tax=Streptomyces sp. NPDC006632 TaxID=3157182 RepID=UPI00339DC094
MRRVSSTRAFARVAPHVVPAMDRAVHRLTRGKVLLSAQMLPGVVLTARGAKSGLARSTPLACMPLEESGAWVLIGSNFGRPGHPAWTANLLVHPDAEISWKGRDIAVRARLLEGAERAAAWRAALDFWPPYATYQSRIEREIRLFRLEPRADGPRAQGAL